MRATGHGVYRGGSKNLMNNLLALNLFEFILGIAVLILLHEFGHFLVARLFNIEVEEFGIGFPPRMVKLFEHKGTEFTLNWIPLGGFVRPKGENDPDVPGGLAAASPWARLAVLAAGPLMNLLIGFLLAILFFFSIGEPILDQVIIRQVAPDSPASTAQLQEGDLILAIEGIEINGSQDVIDLISERLDQPVEITLQRGEQVLTTSMVPRSDPPEGQGAIGIVMGNPSRPVDAPTAVSRGAQLFSANVRGIVTLPGRLLSGDASPEEGRLVGYKGMFDIYQELDTPLYFFMAISISLGLLNLFPIPALDGGRILFILPEILLRKRIPQRYENAFTLVGFTLMILLLIYVNLQDFINPINLP